ncbi:PPC domain-containing protein [Prosthecobacter sp.]|uniref:PPC domain-containing protein n=1 Tax=Prosthecobacter sp. TaxID=1965333 RepID=UPI001D9FD64E|nr:PPC domain-containing protein [Prosthecobacter sp.]MCB1276199.1 PPC domain-containing protein [Prosthecobacter sp.]
MRARAGLIALTFGIAAHAAPPAFDSLYPAGGSPGGRMEVTVAGKGLEKDSPAAWTSDPHIVVLAGDKPKKYFLNIAKDAAPGAYLMRLYNDEGSTQPRIIEVGRFEEVIEKEPNDSLSDVQAAEAKMNVTINGTLEKSGDVDTHTIRVQKGKRITLELHGYALGSPMDPAIRLLNERGIEIAGGHDTYNLDPRIEYTPTADGTLFVQIFAFAHPPAADVSLKGSANHVYRLTVTDEPKPVVAINEPKTLTIPAKVTGSIGKPAEEDRYAVTAKKGDEWQIDVRAYALRSPLDATLRIEDAEGKVIQQTDDVDNTDPSLKWKAPKDGDYAIIVADRFQHGSADHLYELDVHPFTPRLTATLDTHAYRIEAGKTVEVKVTVKTNGTFSGKIMARATQLPPGVTCPEVEVPAKGGEVKLKLTAAADAAASQAPFGVEIVAGAPDSLQTFAASYAIPFTEPRGDLLIMSDTHPWLTVAIKKP